MNTIEERAKEYSGRIFHNEIDKIGRFIGYLEGAREQRKIDIDKACECYCKLACKRYNNQKERYKDCWHRLHNQCCLLNDFREAMEE